ncbi:hypothetical protein VE23_04500 [Paenibacillus sp. D9]|nr:hypothetical protein VE23_04500 [Paenibacillus sp. D9]
MMKTASVGSGRHSRERESGVNKMNKTPETNSIRFMSLTWLGMQADGIMKALYMIGDRNRSAKLYYMQRGF